MAECSMKLYKTKPKDGEFDYTTFEFGEIQSVTTGYSPSISQEAVIVYGFENAMCHDKGGVTKTIRVSFTRVNPLNPDNTSGHNTDSWSNSKWLTVVKKVLGEWQARTSGFTLKIECDVKELFPSILENVFISSIYLPKTANSQIIAGSIDFKVGSVESKEAPPEEEYTLTYSPQVAELYAFYASVVIGGGLPVAYPPKDWIEYMAKNTKTFTGWSLTPNTIHVDYRPQDQIVPTSDTSLYAIWRDYIMPKIYKIPGQYQHIVHEGITKVKVYCVGGGGAGGNPGLQEGVAGHQKGAGGGSSGQITVTNLNVKEGDVIHITIGVGGRATSAEGAEGGTGGDSKVEFGGETFIAKGGPGGSYNAGAWGLERAYSGGDGSYFNYRENVIYPGERGDGGVIKTPTHDFTDAFRGLPGTSVGFNDYRTMVLGGGGGGAQNFSGISYQLGAMLYSIGIGGGNGGSWNSMSEELDVTAGSTGQSGAGGGGGAFVKKRSGLSFTTGGNGGDGFAIVEEFYD